MRTRPVVRIYKQTSRFASSTYAAIQVEMPILFRPFTTEIRSPGLDEIYCTLIPQQRRWINRFCLIIRRASPSLSLTPPPVLLPWDSPRRHTITQNPRLVPSTGYQLGTNPSSRLNVIHGHHIAVPAVLRFFSTTQRVAHVGLWTTSLSSTSALFPCIWILLR